MIVNWSDKEVLERLFLATLASIDKINISEVVRLYHQEDMTYYALENRLRKWKKEAAALKAEVDGVPPPAKSPTKSKAKKGGVSPSKDAVKTGRVTKKKAAAKVKSEPLTEDEDQDEDKFDEFV